MGRYYPTEEQVRIRSKARRLYDDGYRLIGEWCSKIPELTMKKWRVWEAEGGFFDWWTDLFPEHASVTLADLRALEFEANRALMANVSEGDMQAVQMVIKMIGLQEARESSQSSSMDSWFSGTEEENDWIPPIADA
jgi:hypothetical protein|tara:strand:- start:91 stop:498 length:408 start_codon:yes stop_codon:yes gene_type:complete